MERAHTHRQNGDGVSRATINATTEERRKSNKKEKTQEMREVIIMTGQREESFFFAKAGKGYTIHGSGGRKAHEERKQREKNRSKFLGGVAKTT